MTTRAVRVANLAGWLYGRKRPVTLPEIAERYAVSKRTAYRLVDDLRAAGVLVEREDGFLARPPKGKP